MFVKNIKRKETKKNKSILRLYSATDIIDEDSTLSSWKVPF